MGDILNVVYDNWVDGEAQPNLLNTTQPNRFRILDGFFRFYDDSSHKIYHRMNKCKIEDVYKNPNENYFYFINGIGNVHNTFKEYKTIPLPEIVSECFLSCNNFNIIFLNEHEYETEDYLLYIDSYFTKRGFNLSRIFVINNNAEMEILKFKTGTKLNVYSSEFLLKFIARHLSFQNSKYVKDKEGFFMCHNRSPKTHRYTLLVMLMKLGILENVDWSLIMGWAKRQKTFTHFYNGILYNEEIEHLKPEIDYFDSIDIKRSKYEEESGWFEAEEVLGSFNWEKIYETKTYENTYVNIVSESNYDFDAVHITEKSLKPFHFYQLPIFLSSQRHVKYLRELHHFDLFDDFIDHSYDKEPNIRKRFFMVLDEIKRLNKNKEKVIEFYNNNFERFEKNKQAVSNIFKSTKDVNYFFDYLINKEIK